MTFETFPGRNRVMRKPVVIVLGATGQEKRVQRVHEPLNDIVEG